MPRQIDGYTAVIAGKRLDDILPILAVTHKSMQKKDGG
jgi:hypothetical protein